VIQYDQFKVVTFYIAVAKKKPGRAPTSRNPDQ
jgi:hypothetical protein